MFGGYFDLLIHVSVAPKSVGEGSGLQPMVKRAVSCKMWQRVMCSRRPGPAAWTSVAHVSGKYTVSRSPSLRDSYEQHSQPQRIQFPKTCVCDWLLAPARHNVGVWPGKRYANWNPRCSNVKPMPPYANFSWPQLNQDRQFSSLKICTGSIWPQEIFWNT